MKITVYIQLFLAFLIYPTNSLWKKNNNNNTQLIFHKLTLISYKQWYFNGRKFRGKKVLRFRGWDGKFHEKEVSGSFRQNKLLQKKSFFKKQ